MNAERLGRLARMLRIRARLTQAELGLRAGVGRRAVSMLERARARELRLGVIEAIGGALGARLDMRWLWNGPELDRLLDAGHASLAAAVKRRLERWGWQVRVEVSYSRYGERGRIDLLAFHEPTGFLIVVELKTELVDIQALLGSLDAKARLAVDIARGIGWRVTAVVPAIVFTENRTTRNRLAALGTLFDRFTLRGRQAISWLRVGRGSGSPAPAGLLWLMRLDADGPTAPRVGQRVRGQRVGGQRVGGQRVGGVRKSKFASRRAQ